ncbi:MAG: twin-arginine translocase TatA/TatE family subunit [Bacteroidales bacterium]|nr:twin-arginine translocase TatA/TatE family subunit [Bacteroidales bacterium]
MNIPFLFIGTTEIVIILIVVLLLFGGKKIPELMNGLGKGVKSFKDGMNGKDEPSANATQAKDEAPASDKKQE